MCQGTNVAIVAKRSLPIYPWRRESFDTSGRVVRPSWRSDRRIQARPASMATLSVSGP